MAVRYEEDPINWVRLDFLCPDARKSSMLIVPEDSVAVLCPACGKWHSLLMLRGLRTDVFAPRFPDGTIHEGYIGAVLQSEPKSPCLPDYGRFYP